MVYLRRLYAAMKLPVLAGPRPAHAAEAGTLDTSDASVSRSTFSNDGAEDHRRAGSVGAGFRGLTLATVIFTLALVTLGGVVRLTDSGLGCPDWPLCHGKIIPPADTATLIEYSHRLLASVTGLLVLATTIIVWRSYRKQPWLLVPATLAFILLIVQVLLGGFTVLRELPASIVLAHLATAEALIATLVVVCMVAFRGPPLADSREGGHRGGLDRFLILVLVTLLAGYALLLSGSYVTVSGATVSCGQWWPLCQGQFIPEGYYATIHMAHRVVGLLVGALIVAVLVMAWRRKDELPAMRWTTVIVGGLFLVQIMIGATILWMGFPLILRLLHLVAATLVWVGLAALAVLSYRPATPTSALKGVSGA